MGFRTLCMVYSTGREISKGEWREKAGEIFLKITNIFNVSSKNSGVLLLRTLFQLWAAYSIQTYGNATIPSPPPVMCLQTYGEALIEYFTLCQMETRSIFFHPTLRNLFRIAENKKITRIIHRRYIVPLFEKSTLELNSKINSIEKSIFLSHSLLFHDIPSTLRAFPFFEPPLRTETGALSTGGGNFIFPSLDMPRTARFDQILIPPFRLKAFLPSLSLPLSG